MFHLWWKENLVKPQEVSKLYANDCGYEWVNKGFNLTCLLFMGDLKLFAKSKNLIDSLVQTVHMFSEDMGMQFGMVQLVCYMVQDF